MNKVKKNNNPDKLGHCATTWTNISFRSCVGKGSRDSSVGVAMGYGLGGQGSIHARARYFSLLHSVQTDSGSHPVSCPMSVRARGVKLTTQLHLVSR
jgi:hypothetical protein